MTYMHGILETQLKEHFGEADIGKVPENVRAFVMAVGDTYAKLDRGREPCQEELLEATLEASSDGILVVGNDRKIVFFNTRFLDIWKIPKELAETKDDEKLLAFVLGQLSSPETFVKRLRELYSSGEADFGTLVFKDGRYLERYSRALHVGGEQAARVFSFRDVTERKLAEDSLRAKAEELERMNRLMIGRELRMSELKEELERLKAEKK